ncbi:hypothetical protein Barb4_01979 [Bacteroidales bacterium Barb4]|nr:hypothetical protein Barb4_01979 [Bacteroidales bacterium Barb4]
MECGVYGYTSDEPLTGFETLLGVNYRPFRTSLPVSSLTPHFASLHVGLKSGIPSEFV